MEHFLAQTNSTKLIEKDFDRILDFYEKFSECVIFQDTEERQAKLFEMFKKLSKLEKPKSATKRSVVQDKAVEAKEQKLNSIKISKVPDEIWIKILNFMGSKTIFSHFALVCKKFHELTLDSGAVKNIRLIKIKTQELYEKAVKVLKRSRNLSRIQIEYGYPFGNALITETFRSNPKLKSLIIEKESKFVENWFNRSKIDKKVFGKKLETLSLGSAKLKDEIMNEILSQKNLKALQIPVSFDSNKGSQSKQSFKATNYNVQLPTQLKYLLKGQMVYLYIINYQNTS